MLPALQDEVRPLAGGLLDQVPNPCVLSSPTGSESAVMKEVFASGDYDGRRSVTGPDMPQCCYENSGTE